MVIIRPTIPSCLAEEIARFDALVKAFRNGTIPVQDFRPKCAAFGVYEQRANGYMVRARCPAGVISLPQLKAVSDISERYGRQSLHVTTRQELQIHDVDIASLITVIRALYDAGLATLGGGANAVRNVVASWDAGVSCDEMFDVTPYAVAVSNRLMEQADSRDLPRKFKVVFSNTDADSAQAMMTDVGFIAREKNGELGFSVHVAGGLGRKPSAGHLLHEFIPAREAYEVSAAVKQVFRKYGNRENRNEARLRFLWRTLGEDGFRQRYEEELAAVRSRGTAAMPEPERHGSAANGKRNMKPTGDAAFDAWCSRYVFAERVAGRYSVLVPLLFGTLPVAHARTLAALGVKFGSDTLRCTIDQNIVLRGIPEASLRDVGDVVRTIAPLSSMSRVAGMSVACTGAAVCRLGVCEAPRTLAAVMDAIANVNGALDKAADVRVGISGCFNSCGRHWAADLGFCGTRVEINGVREPGYEVVAGGSGARLAEPVAVVAERFMPAFVTRTLQAYCAVAEKHASFGAYVEAGGASAMQAVAAELNRGHDEGHQS